MKLHRTPVRPARRTSTRLGAVAAGLALPLVLAACGGGEGGGVALAADAALPEKVPSGTVLRVGDPATQVVLEQAGLDKELEQAGVEVEWANITGGPKSLEAFRADALDVSSVADIPPLFAHWTDTEVKIVAARETVDPLDHPVYQLGIAPGAGVRSLDDLKGKKIAYSPGQAQGALVLRVLQEAGLTQDDVELVEMQSVDDTFANALGSKQIDVAPLGQSQVGAYLEKYAGDGAAAIKPGVRDDAWTLYAPVETVEDADKAAALREYVEVWAKAQLWINDHPDEFAQLYYVDHEGLPLPEAKKVVAALGKNEVPTDWTGFIERHQETADLLSEEQGQPEVDVEDLYDRRYEKAIAQALADTGAGAKPGPAASKGAA